jgi:hypothetical protein
VLCCCVQALVVARHQYRSKHPWFVLTLKQSVCKLAKQQCCRRVERARCRWVAQPPVGTAGTCACGLPAQLAGIADDTGSEGLGASKNGLHWWLPSTQTDMTCTLDPRAPAGVSWRKIPE